MTREAEILFVVTSHTKLGATGKPTGVWLEELALPYLALAARGAKITIASPAGGPIPIDPGSLRPKGEAPVMDAFLARPEIAAALIGVPSVAALAGQKFDALFLPGGHGTMWDLPVDAHLAALIGRMADAGKPVAAVCHGAAGLVAAKRADGTPVVAGYRVNSFTDAEERAVGLSGVVPFALQSRLEALGARFEHGPDFQAFAVVDRGLITGQNPASSSLVAEALATALGLAAPRKAA